MGTSDRHPITRVLLLLLFPFVLVIPFLGGLFSGGYVALRFLVAVPFALAGVMAVGLPRHPAGRMSVIVIAAFVLLQFATATNSLFGGSHLALQQDRALGTQLILQIEVEMSRAPVTPQFLEIVGVPSRSVTQLMPQSETFGASFFEWGEGNVYRIILFLRTLGFDDLSGLGAAERGEYVATGSAMPIFPAPGSVMVEGDVIIVKFGPYTATQTRVICDHSPEAEVCSG